MHPLKPNVQAHTSTQCTQAREKAHLTSCHPKVVRLPCTIFMYTHCTALVQFVHELYWEVQHVCDLS